MLPSSPITHNAPGPNDILLDPALIAEVLRRHHVSLALPPYAVITLDPSEHVVLSELSAAEQTGALPQRGA